MVEIVEIKIFGRLIRSLGWLTAQGGRPEGGAVPLALLHGRLVGGVREVLYPLSLALAQLPYLEVTRPSNRCSALALSAQYY